MNTLAALLNCKPLINQRSVEIFEICKKLKASQAAAFVDVLYTYDLMKKGRMIMINRLISHHNIDVNFYNSLIYTMTKKPE